MILLPPKKSPEIILTNSIYDNIHGFIKLTSLEYEIVNSPFFQRLRNIKQLGLLDYVFPGAIHNRFNHSLGVLHVADKMTVSLQDKGFLKGKRSIIRMAALLHDIGHYPLSHLIKEVVKEDAKVKLNMGTIYSEKVIRLERDDSNQKLDIIDISNHEIHKLILRLHGGKNSDGYYAHHERIASLVIFKTHIYEILKKQFTDKEINNIVQIIAGSYPGVERFIIHSELDADRFDYLLRDSTQTGIIYGLFDLDQIIRNLDMYARDDNRIVVGIKGRKAVEHYLMCKYFLYSTVIYHKTNVGFEIAVKKIYEGLMEQKLVHSYFDLIDIFKDTSLCNKYLEYDDSYFFDILKKISSGNLKWENNKEYNVKDELLLAMINKVLNRQPLTLVYEQQRLLRNEDSKKESSLKDLIFNETVIDDIVKKCNIENHWYITKEISVPFASIGPHRSLSDDNIDVDKKLETIKILDNGEITNLVEDHSSIIWLLSDSKLSINRIYTKNKIYRDKLSPVIDAYIKKK